MDKNSMRVNIPPGYHAVNPFIVTENTKELLRFLQKVFKAKENTAAFAIDEMDGKVIHSEVSINDTLIMIFDRKEQWPYIPSLLQVYVNDIDTVLKTAESLGSAIVTKQTPFYGGLLARFIDPWGNLWWVSHMPEVNEDDWTADENQDQSETWSQDEGDDMNYIRDSLVEGIQRLNQFVKRQSGKTL